tara:strand:- start:2250 stop:2705 length:456 start_codon:yes stop_codon:yes gene_type:complete
MIKYLLVFLLFFLISCVSFQDLEYKGFTGLSFSKTHGCDPFCANIDIYNPNKYNIKLKNGSGEALINSKNIGEIKINNNAVLKSEQTSTIELIIVSSSNQFMKTLFSSIDVIMGKTVKLKIEGKIKAKVYGLGKQISFSEQQDLRLKDFRK